VDKVKNILAVMLALFSISSIAGKDQPFSQIIPMKVLCTEGGPEYLILELMERYNEVPAYVMEISVDKPLSLGMIITENKNNPSSTIIMTNPNIGVSCIFMTAKDVVRPTGAESLPAKEPEETGPKLGV
jgi:hypothetical protein